MYSCSDPAADNQALKQIHTFRKTVMSVAEFVAWWVSLADLKCVQRKLGTAGTALEMHLSLFQSIKRPFQIPVAHFDRNRTIKYQF